MVREWNGRPMITTYELAGPSLARYLVFESTFGKYAGGRAREGRRFRSRNERSDSVFMTCTPVSRKHNRSKKSLFSLRDRVV